MPITENDLAGAYDGDVLSASGEKIGRVAQVYLDDQSGEPTFVTATTGLFGTSQSFVPLRGARVENGDVVVQFDKVTVKDAPRIDDDGSLSPADEDQLYAYYGMSRNDADNADYGLSDQTPEPGESSAAGFDQTNRVDTDVRGEDRPGAVEGNLTPEERDAFEGSAREGDRSAALAGVAGEPATDYGTEATSTVVGEGRAPNGSDAGSDRSAAGTGGQGRLRKWAMTEYEPVESKKVIVSGDEARSDQPPIR